MIVSPHSTIETKHRYFHVQINTQEHTINTLDICEMANSPKDHFLFRQSNDRVYGNWKY